MKKVVQFGLIMMCVSSVMFSSNLFADGDAPKDAKPKEIIKPKQLVVTDLEVTGTVEKLEPGSGKPSVYAIRNAEKKLVQLQSKIAGKDIDLEQYVGKEVIAKGKGTSYLKTIEKTKETYTSIRLLELLSIELKPATSEKTDKPADKKVEEPKKEEPKKEEPAK